MAIILALDQGTSSSRAVIFESGGAHAAMVRKPLHPIYPQPGWVELDPEEIWQTQFDSAVEALERANRAADEIDAIGITNQRETTLLWSRRTGKPIHRAISWQDRRTADWCARQRHAGLFDWVRNKTGLIIDPYFSASKIVWLLEHVAGARALAEAGELCFGTIDSWLIWQLTQKSADGPKHLTDITNASRTMLFNIHTGQWDEELCEAFKIPMAILPKVMSSTAVYGTTNLFGGELRIAGVAGDQQAALFGQGCHKPGQAKNTYGTGCFLLLHTGDEAVMSRHGLLTTAAAQVSRDHEYALEGQLFDAGSAVEWLCDQMGVIESVDAIESLAATVPDSGGVIIVPAFNGLAAPYWDPRARGTIVGLTRSSNRAHLARAVLDSIALQSAELLHAMQSDAQVRLTELLADGAAASNDLLMQMQADLLGVPVRRPKNIEATAFGVATLAAQAIGIFQYADLSDVESDIFEPQLTEDLAQARIDRWREAVGRARDWAE